MSIDTEEFKKEFIEEAREYLDILNRSIIRIEEGELDLIDEVFRCAHTLKGMAGTLGYENLQGVSHRLEDIFDGIRSGEITVSPDNIDTVLNGVDRIERMIDKIDAENTDDLEEKEREKEKRALKISITLSDDCTLKGIRAYLVIQTMEEHGEVLKITPPMEDIEDEKFGLDFSVILRTDEEEAEIREVLNRIADLERIKITKSEVLKEEERAQESKIFEYPKKEITKEHISVVRVDINRLDKIMNLIGELVISDGRLSQIGKEYNIVELNDALEGAGRSMTELQNEIMTIRMVPISRIFNRFPRMVRDYCRETGKKIKFVMEGGETELDRAILDDIIDPLVHLIRNSMDHGIELPEDRISVGKAEEGYIKLSARRERDDVIVEVEDDGVGIDIEDVRRKAVEKGILSQEEVDKLDDEVAKNLILLPGFSTSKAVGELSGRGVGMDVVKTRVEALGGSVRIYSKKGEGMKVVLSLPPSMAIAKVLIADVSGERYAIPLNDVLEIARIGDVGAKTLYKRRVLSIRGKVIPLILLSEVFKNRRLLNIFNLNDDAGGDAIIVERNDEEIIALVVDGVLDQRDILIKPLDRFLSDIRGIGGMTILGDGKVVPIIDINSLPLDGVSNA
ncbi:MAG: chemotaxis protein CheA [Candidatus Methanolliviera sp. GoM_oil]|nr:MAG: chemotaxis protein CheA [Candidatus Methanolliviera sp. GoM_oil]